MNTPGYTIIFHSIIYLSFFALLLLSKKKKGLRLFNEEGLVSNPTMLILLHVAGIVLFGFVPYLFHTPSPFVLYNSRIAGVATAVTGLCIVVLLFVSARTSEKKYSEITNKPFVNTPLSSQFIVVYFLLRTVFIASYECWFRGYLLNDSIVSFGVPLAIVINVCLYALLHVVNGKVEMLGCLPFGIVLCCLSIWQAAVWPAVIIHLALTLSYEIGFIRNIQKNKLLQYEDFHNRSVGVSR